MATEPSEPTSAPTPVGFDALHRADDLVAEYVRAVPTPAIPTTLIGLDKWLRGGIRPGRIYTIAGRPGEGKSSLLLSLARRMALDSHVPVVYLSLEMGKEELTERLVAQSLLTPPDLLGSWRASGLLATKLAHLHQAFQEANLHLEDDRRADILSLESFFEELVQSAIHPKVLVIDYLQLIAMPQGLSRSDAINTYMADLKNFAKSKHVAILLGCQINRQGHEKPSLIHLKGAGGIEESSDVVMICSSARLDATTVSEDVEQDCEYEIWIAKHRQGALYKLGLMFRPPCFEFLDVSTYGIPKHPALEVRVVEERRPGEDMIEVGE